ncbi:MAG: nucleotidyltransferase domain-containing protein [archaeon]
MHKQYTSYFVAYLNFNLPKKELENISKIILFGSTAKNEANKDSDIDLFIEVRKKPKSFENKIQKITEKFYKSREALIFKSKNIDSKINILIGKLNDWPELKNSIESTGIILYGRYIPENKAGEKKYSIIFWDKIGKNRGAFLNKIYGFNVKKKNYRGLIETLDGKKLGKSTIMIPSENTNEILNLLKPYKVNAKVIEVYA